jgi:transposase
MDRAVLDSLDREHLIEIILAQAAMIEQLTRRVAELEARLGLPPKTPDNSSVPPSQGRKASAATPPASKRRRRRKGRSGAHRAMASNPTQIVEMRASCCPHCRADVSSARQWLCEAYDHVELPPIAPEVTRIKLYGGACPNCSRRFKAAAPADMPPGSPFGAKLRALVIYLRYTHGIGFARLSRTLHDLFGMEISEGALVNMLKRATVPFAAQTARIRGDLMAAPGLASDETGLRVGKRNFWLWVIHHKDSAVFLADPTRAKRVLEDFLADHRPAFWLSDRYSGQKGLARRQHQFCLAHLIRDAQYAMDAGDDCFAPGLIVLLKRACRIGRRRDQLSDRQLAFYNRKFVKKLSELLRLRPTHEEGIKLHKTIGESRRNLFVFITNRALEATNNASERALRPCVTFRKITNGFRTEWGAKLYADIRSVLETARRRDVNPLDALTSTLSSRPLLCTQA